jgi:hypothetical protein
MRLRWPAHVSLRMLVMVAALLAIPATAKADDWKFAVTPYFWAADVSLDARINGNTVLAADVDLSDLLDKLDLAFSAHAEMYTEKGGSSAPGTPTSLGTRSEPSGSHSAASHSSTRGSAGGR